jgi:hypothetical protein
MIRKNALLCKLIHIKTSSKSLFQSCMATFQPELETCPACRSTGNCHVHDYYDRSIIDLKNGQQKRSSLCILRLLCSSCRKTHAVLPDILIPYSGYSLLFILRLLGEYFSGSASIERLCEKYKISKKQLYKWLDLWIIHKQEWLGVLADAECSNLTFWKSITSTVNYSDFAMNFYRCFQISFLQSHADPLTAGAKTACCHQDAFPPNAFGT